MRQIFEREQEKDERRQELAEAARRPDQPNPLHLEPRLRSMLVEFCGKTDFTAGHRVVRDIGAQELHGQSGEIGLCSLRLGNVLFVFLRRLIFGHVATKEKQGRALRGFRLNFKGTI